VSKERIPREDKQGILEVLNLEDHATIAPSRLRDREAGFPWRRASQEQNLPNWAQFLSRKHCISSRDMEEL